MYDSGVRVPLIAAWKGYILSGRVYDDLAELTDIAPTLLEACGLGIHAGMQGRSLYKTLTEGVPGSRDSVYCEYYNSNIRHVNPKAYLTMVRGERYKLIRSHGAPGGVGGELYDLENDPDETVNLYGSEQYAGIQIKMLELMADRMAETADPLPVRRAFW
jgi:arylsulfatase A-like enzyme